MERTCPLLAIGQAKGDVAMEGHFANPAIGFKPEAHQHADAVSELSTIGIVFGTCLTIGLLVLAFPFSDQVAISLSLLS